MIYRICLLAVVLGGCSTTRELPIVRDRVSEVRVAVAAPCRQGERPTEPVSLRDRFTNEEWQAMTTDQRENLVSAQGLDRKVYGDRLAVNTAGCP